MKNQILSKIGGALISAAIPALIAGLVIVLRHFADALEQSKETSKTETNG